MPVIDEASGSVIGHIVAEKSTLVSALNSAGFTEVGAGLAAAEAGAGAGLAVGAGITAGTIGAGSVAAAVAIGLVVASTAADDSTSTHTPASHH
ncbi:MAG: hypothetical protein HZC49_04265 [Nitrospirae bacterium]|nr:hypothetical protein [Nitrospirota bacterium]